MIRINILDIPIDKLSMKEAIQKIEGFIQSGKPHQVTTINPEFIVEAQSNKEFANVLKEANLALADGAGVIWASRWQKQHLPERITGADLVVKLAELGARKDWKIYLLGGEKGIAKRAADKLEGIYQDIRIVGVEEGLRYELSDQLQRNNIDNLILRIKKAKPDILLVAFGAPKQDIFIARYKKDLGVPAMIGVGGTFDFLAGKTKRAPAWIQNISLEWLWRLIQEPRRFKRILKAVIIFPLMVLMRHKQ